MTKKKIMVVDDDKLTVDFLKTLLELNGYEAIPILSGEECLAKVRDIMPELILLDIMMPEVDGWAVLENLGKDPELKSIPIIIVTAKDQPIDKLLAFDKYKVIDYIVKPFSNKELLEKIRNVIGKP
jgi:CheY-like chemotaxis protein